MRRALALAKRGWGKVAPNPMVGCVIARGDTILSEGYHKSFGSSHAEPDALRLYSGSSQGVSLYVTLEPCTHFGKTPPCTDLILKSGIKRVVIGAVDPNPAASGGAEILRKNGVACEIGLLDRESRSLNRAFFTQLAKKKPMVSLKLASTLDGCIARGDGSSQWITSIQARRKVHYLRGGHQAILVGRNTLLRDDPQLDCRLVRLPSPARVCIDRSGDLPSSLKIFKSGNVFYFSPRTRDDLPAHIHQVPLQEIQSYELIYKRVFDELYIRGIHSLFVEGGAGVASFFIENDLVDYAYLFYGGTFFGRGGIRSFQGKSEPLFQIEKTQKLGDSFLLEGRFLCSPES